MKLYHFFLIVKQVVSQQEERLKLLVSNNNKLQAHVDKLNAPLTFIDFIVDVFEHQSLPACDTAIEKATPYVKMAGEYIQYGWSVVVDFWNTNSVCLVVREKAIECYVKSTTLYSFILSFNVVSVRSGERP